MSYSSLGPFRGRDVAAAREHRKRVMLCLPLVSIAALAGCAPTGSLGLGSEGPIHRVPAAIVADCSVDVTTELLAWIASVPDSSTLEFGRDACYNIDGGLVIDDRHGLTFEGNGATFQLFTKGSSNRSNWWFRGGSDITLRNMIVRGANPYAGTGPLAYDGAVEWQHAFRFGATQTATLENVEAYDVYGDFVEAERDLRLGGGGPPARKILVRNSHFERNGRMGVGLTHVEEFTLEDSYIGEVAWSAIDLELDVDSRIGRDIRIVRNRFGAVRHSIFTHGGLGADPGGVVVSDNVMLADPLTCQPPLLVGTPAGRYWSGYTFENNELRTLTTGVTLVRAKDVIIRGNRITKIGNPNGCSRESAVLAQDSHEGLVTLNVSIGAPAILAVDSLTTDFREMDNELHLTAP